MADNDTWWNKVCEFLTTVVVTAKDKVVSFVVGIYHHWETTTVLILSSIGLNALLGEIPFVWAVPLWIEAPMVIPVAATLIIYALVKNAERRSDKRRRMGFA